MAPTKQKNKRNVSLEIFKTSVCFLSMTVQLGLANNHVKYHIHKDWFEKSERGPYIVECVIPKVWNASLHYIINVTIFPLHIYRFCIAKLIFRSSLSFPRVNGFFSTAAHLLILSWNFSYSLTELQNYSLCEFLIKSSEAPKSGKSTTATKIDE